MSILEQSYKDIEVIVVNDGSTDESVTSSVRLLDNRIRYFEKPNGGKSSAMNLAFRVMKGRYWTIQDGDDISHPRRIEVQISALKSDDDLAAVFVGNDIIFGQSKFGERFLPKDPEHCREEIYKFRLPAHDATGMYDRTRTGEVFFDESLRIGQGVDYVFKIAETKKIRVLAGVFYSHRIEHGSTTHRDPNRNRPYVIAMLKNAYHRRGAPWPGEQIVPKATSSILFKHRNKDTIVSYAREAVKQNLQVSRFRRAAYNAFVCTAAHPLDPLYWSPWLTFARYAIKSDTKK